MRYAPYAQEYEDVSSFNENQLLEYFLTRIFETEEIWGLDNGAEWIYRVENGEETTLPLWPYKRYADNAATGQWQEYMPTEVSLEELLYNILSVAIEDDIMVEIMSLGPDNKGGLISPQQLFSILEGMLDAGEYRLDG